MFNSVHPRFSGVYQYVGRRKPVEYIISERASRGGIGGIRSADTQMRNTYEELVRASGRKIDAPKDCVVGVLLNDEHEEEYLKRHPLTIFQKVKGDLDCEMPDDFFEYAKSHNPDATAAIRKSNRDTLEIYGPWKKTHSSSKTYKIPTPPQISVKEIEIGKNYRSFFSRDAERCKTIRETENSEMPDSDNNPFKDFYYAHPRH